MNYYINIIDTTDDTHVTIDELAAANSIVLNYEGKDAKDDLAVVGSTLAFTMEVPHDNNIDGAFLHLFTGDETKYLVELRNEDTDALIWHGFLLPDSYSEPYTNGNFFVEFVAADGLGRLKGKYLPDNFYEDEISVVGIIAECLKATGLEMDIIVAPGIDNVTQKNWHEIYLYTDFFIKKSKKQDAHKILKSLAEDMLFVVYQHLNTWRVEGLNKRNLTSYKCKSYTYLGVYIADTTINRTVKDVEGVVLATPSVTMLAPYGSIEVTHEKQPIQLPDTAVEEVNDGWVDAAGVELIVYATDWFTYGGFFAKAKEPDYNLWLEGRDNDTFNSALRVTLLKKIFIKKNTKIRFKAEFEIDYYGTSTSSDIDDIIADGYWRNPLKYALTLNDVALFTNTTASFTTAENVIFDTDKEASLNFEFLTPEDGLFDIIFYQPVGTLADAKLNGVYVTKIEIEEISFEDELLYTDVLNEDYTINKQLELTYADDAAGFSKAFRLQPLEEKYAYQLVEFLIPIISGFTQSSEHYSVVSLAGANIIADNIDTTYYGFTQLTDIEVIYNYQYGEQMVIKTPIAYTTGNFSVKKFKYVDQTEDRVYWEEWTDSVYEIERSRYPEAVMNVYRRLYTSPEPKIDLTVQMPLLFGDLITWNYLEQTTYTPTNLSFNFDNGESTLTMVKAAYEQGGDLIPPIVDAGPDIYLATAETYAYFDATAYDPDGTIVSYLWEKVTGDSGETIIAPTVEDTGVSNLTGDEYEFKITVTDNDALTAFDTVKVIRIVDYTVTLDLQSSAEGVDTKTVIYRLGVTPSFPADENINFAVSFTLTAEVDPENAFGTNATAEYTLTKNGIILENQLIEENNIIGEGPNTITVSTSFNYQTGDVIDFELEAFAEATLSYFARGRAQVNLLTATIIDYPGVILGLPIQKLCTKEGI